MDTVVRNLRHEVEGDIFDARRERAKEILKKKLIEVQDAKHRLKQLQADLLDIEERTIDDPMFDEKPKTTGTIYSTGSLLSYYSVPSQ